MSACGKPGCDLHRSVVADDGATKTCPACSCTAGEPVYLPMDQFYVHRGSEGPKGGGGVALDGGKKIQSWCTGCSFGRRAIHKEWSERRARLASAKYGLAFLRAMSEIVVKAARCRPPYLIRHHDVLDPVRGVGQILGREGRAVLVLFERDIAWMGEDSVKQIRTVEMS